MCDRHGREKGEKIKIRALLIRHIHARYIEIERREERGERREEREKSGPSGPIGFNINNFEWDD